MCFSKARRSGGRVFSPDVADLGRYVVADYCAGELMALTPSGNGKFRVQDLGLNLGAVSSFGQAANRDLYVLSQSRGIFKLVPR